MDKPRVLKGGLAYYESASSPLRAVTFQYNPDSLHRTIAPADGYDRPREVVVFTLALDATDGLERADPAAVSLGILPALCALEKLVQHPGKPGEKTPLTLFVWGTHRVIPVRITQLLVREEMFNVNLTPSRALVDVTMETLTSIELNNDPRARVLMDAYLAGKEKLSALALPGTSLEEWLGGGAK